MMPPHAASPGKSTRAGPRYLSAHPARFGHFASLPLPDVAGALDELDYALDELGSDGSPSKPTAPECTGDDRYEPLYREPKRRRAVVAALWFRASHVTPVRRGDLHSAAPADAGVRLRHSPATVSHLVFTGTLLRYPGIEWVFTHGGGALPLLAERIELLRALCRRRR